MPDDKKKKPAKKTAASRAPAKKKAATRGRTAAGRTAAKASPTRRSAPTRKPPARRKPPVTEPETHEIADQDLFDEDAPATTGSGPVVIGIAGQAADSANPEAATVVADSATDEAVATSHATTADDAGVPERYPEDIPIMVVSAVLAASVFLPWYKLNAAFRQTTVTATGWETGTWGPMIFFFGLASLAIAILRRAGVRVGLPVADSHLHEGIGWAAIIGAVIKLRAVPREQGIQMGWTWGIIVAIVAAFALAFLAGRMSGSMTFTTIPGWFRGRAGKIGLAVLVLAIAGSTAFGITQNVSPYGLATGRSTTPGNDGGINNNVLRGRFPTCAEGFPRPADAKPREGVEQRGQSPCVFTFSTTRTPDQLLEFYTAELKKAGYVFVPLPSRGDAAGHAITMSSPKCGSMSMQRAEGAAESTVIVAVGGPCPTIRPGSRTTPSPAAS